MRCTASSAFLGSSSCSCRSTSTTATPLLAELRDAAASPTLAGGRLRSLRRAGSDRELRPCLQACRRALMGKLQAKGLDWKFFQAQSTRDGLRLEVGFDGANPPKAYQLNLFESTVATGDGRLRSLLERVRPAAAPAHQPAQLRAGHRLRRAAVLIQLHRYPASITGAGNHHVTRFRRIFCMQLFVTISLVGRQHIFSQLIGKSK